MLAPPYRTGGATYGYSMQDAVLPGGLRAGADEALVINLTHPACRFWNFTLWNQFMSAVETEYSRSGINCGSAIPNSDGSTTIVIARQLLEHPNALSTKDHAEGLMAFRWFFAADMPGTSQHHSAFRRSGTAHRQLNLAAVAQCGRQPAHGQQNAALGAFVGGAGAMLPQQFHL